MVTFDVSLLRQRSPDEHISLASYNVEVQPTDTDPIKRLEDAARSHINKRFASLGVTCIEHFLDLEQSRKTALEQMELAHRAARERSLSSKDFPPFAGRVARDACREEGTKKRKTHHLIAIFAISPLVFNLKVRGVIKSSKKIEFCFEETVEAPPDDTAQVIHGIALRHIDQDDTLSVESGSSRLYGMDKDEYDMVLDSGTGPLGRGKATLYESTKKVSTMKPNLVFEAMLIRHLQIPFVAFHRRSDSYNFLCQNRAAVTSEDTVQRLREDILDSIQLACPQETETRYEISVYEPKEAFQSAYNKPSDELENLELGHGSLSGKMCFSFLPRNRLSCWREGQTLIAVAVSTSGQPQPPVAELVEGLTRLRIAKDAPSDVAKVPNYKKLQRDSKQRILDDRPDQDPLIAPISLLYQPFGYFHDVRCGKKFQDPRLDINGAEFKSKVNALADHMADFQTSEKERRSTFIKDLETILKLSPNVIGSTKIPGTEKISDGHLSGDHGAIVVCVECKNELSAASCEPVVQLTSYIAVSFKGQAEDHRDLFNRWRIPALGVTLVGPTIQFFGVVFVGQMRVVPLTPALPMTDPVGEGFRRDLLQAFKAAALVYSRIKLDIEKYLDVLKGSAASWPPLMTEVTCRFPSVTEVDAFPNSQEKLMFVLNHRYDDDTVNRHLYKATVVSPADRQGNAYVKFSQRYSSELHEFCASRGLAPRILGFKELSGGWFVVAMEEIDTVDRTNIGSSSNAEKWEEDIRKLVKDFHCAGLVHGDLRLANFVFTKDLKRMLLVDFDWGGKVGEVTFPDNELNEELEVPNNDLLDRLITEEHDERCLDKVLEWVRGRQPGGSGQGMEM